MKFFNNSYEWVDIKWSKKLGRLINAFISALQVEPWEPFSFKLKGGPHQEGHVGVGEVLAGLLAH